LKRFARSAIYASQWLSVVLGVLCVNPFFAAAELAAYSYLASLASVVVRQHRLRSPIQQLRQNNGRGAQAVGVAIEAVA
jgi:hypothetical protein